MSTQVPCQVCIPNTRNLSKKTCSCLLPAKRWWWWGRQNSHGMDCTKVTNMIYVIWCRYSVPLLVFYHGQALLIENTELIVSTGPYIMIWRLRRIIIKNKIQGIVLQVNITRVESLIMLLGTQPRPFLSIRIQKVSRSQEETLWERLTLSRMKI